jgi:hypothetical protein
LTGTETSIASPQAAITQWCINIIPKDCQGNPQGDHPVEGFSHVSLPPFPGKELLQVTAKHMGRTFALLSDWLPLDFLPLYHKNSRNPFLRYYQTAQFFVCVQNLPTTSIFVVLLGFRVGIYERR